MSVPDERPWTAEEAAHYLTWSVETVRRRARAGKLRATKLGEEWRFDPADVRALLKPRSSALHSDPRIVEAQMNAAYTRAMRGIA